ncbi:hypothetical protein HNP40_002278 [Mycobacteroides chelonae]|nr:hypothetical protein [Mycobacteroides chelonae]
MRITRAKLTTITAITALADNIAPGSLWVLRLAATAMFLIPALWLAVLLGAVVFGPRALLRRRQLWIGAAVVIMAAVSTLIWQATRGRTARVVQIYPMAAAYDVEAGREGIVRAYSFHRGYYYFGAPAESMTDMLYLGVDDPDPELARGFRGVQRIELLHALGEDEAHV